MAKTMKAAPGMAKSTVVRTTMKPVFGGRAGKVRPTGKRGGSGR